MERINAYTTSNKYGDCVIDVEGMVVDLITIAKADNKTLDELFIFIKEIWPEVHVEITRPAKH